MASATTSPVYSI